MGKAGGIIGLIGGIFAVIAALFTLLAGGVGAAFSADKASMVVSFGWYGLAAAFLVIVSGVVAIFKPSVGAFGLLLLSLVGAIVGGTAVAICLVLALLGGVLAASGSTDAAGKRTWWQWTGLPLGLVIAIAMSMQMARPNTEIEAAKLAPVTAPAATSQPVTVAPEPVVATTAKAPMSIENPNDALPQDIAASEYESADKALNEAYQAAMARLDIDAKAALRTSQRAWIKKRDAECKPDPAAGIGPGSAGALDSLGCQTTISATRTSEIRALSASLVPPVSQLGGAAVAAQPVPSPAQAERNLKDAQRMMASELAVMHTRLPADKRASLKADDAAWQKRVAASCAPKSDGGATAGTAAALEYAIETQCTADATISRANLMRSTNAQ